MELATLHQILPLAEFEEYPNSASAAAEFVGRN
jgi:hypothetical protein